nr:hypothetical protein BdHM001_22030 [Bdellovibrio sp. HM001]
MGLLLQSLFSPLLLGSVVQASPTMMPLVGVIAVNLPDPCMAANPAIGTVCKDGTIWLGVLPTSISHAGNNGGKTKYMVAPKSTEVSLPWNDGTANYGSSGVEVVTSLTAKSTVLGDANTAILAAATAPGGGTYKAAKYCKDLNFAGYNDWYLPSKSEMAYIYCKSEQNGHDVAYPQEEPNCVGYGGKESLLKDFFPGSTVFYQSSTEVTGYTKWVQQTVNGQQFHSAGGNNKDWPNYVRCIRRF